MSSSVEETLNKLNIDAEEDDPSVRGVSDLWSSVNHVAIVVSDVGRSLSFYTDIVGMKQVIRPNFDRHGAWLTMGNVDLHLIKGRPAVHPDDDLIVGHIAISVDNMKEFRRRLEKLKVTSRKNVSVPNPADGNNAVLDQAFVRDPDGYYIEFANCATLENYIHAKTAACEKDWNLTKTKSVLKASKLLKKHADNSRVSLLKAKSNLGGYDTSEDDGNDSSTSMDGQGVRVDYAKLNNLIKRRKIYGDITQNAREDELESLLVQFDNKVPLVITALEDRVRCKGTRTYIPPGFYGRDGSFVQPPSFEMSVSNGKTNEKDQ